MDITSILNSNDGQAETVEQQQLTHQIDLGNEKNLSEQNELTLIAKNNKNNIDRHASDGKEFINQNQLNAFDRSDDNEDSKTCDISLVAANSKSDNATKQRIDCDAVESDDKSEISKKLSFEVLKTGDRVQSASKALFNDNNKSFQYLSENVSSTYDGSVNSETFEKHNDNYSPSILTTTAKDLPFVNSASSRKKAISLEKIDETAKKFISGDIIVDKENPFKNLNAKRRAEFFASSVDISSTAALLPNEEFVTKDEVLKESKFVKTYIKNPDEYFVYDPTIKERLLQEELREKADKLKERNSPPKTTTRLSRLTQERFKELKSKYSPSPLYNHQHKTRSNVGNGYVTGGVGINSKPLKTSSKLKSDRWKYPDLSQIKVKTGTDLEGSFFNPKEVAINAKKFDARIKNTHFGSQDDLDEIADLTSGAFDVSEIDDGEPADAVAKSTSNETNPNVTQAIDDKIESFTNTVNSKEFQKYLAEKGLSLLSPKVPAKQSDDCIVLRIIEKNDKMAAAANEVDGKKARKPSVLQRLFPNGFFSSRRRTTPKDTTPEPIQMSTSAKRDNRVSNTKQRLVLHRQSLPAKCDTYDTSLNLAMQPVASDGSSTSISSTLTNVDYVESNKANAIKPMERKSRVFASNADPKIECKFKASDSDTAKSLSGLRYIDSSSNSTIVTCDKARTDDNNQIKVKPIARPRSSVPSNGEKTHIEKVHFSVNAKTGRDTPNTITNKKPDNREHLVKPRSQRPKIPISNLRPLLSNRTDLKIPATNLTKPTCVQKSIQNGIAKGNGDKVDVKKRNLSKMPQRLNQITTLQPTKRNEFDSSPEVQQSRSDAKTPDNETDGPKSTSTPIADSVQPKFHQEQKLPNSDNYFHQKPVILSPIPKPIDNSSEKCRVAMDPFTWAKLRELKEKTDRQLYAQPLLIHAQGSNSHPQNVYNNPRFVQRPQAIYEHVPMQIDPTTNAQSLYAKVDKGSSMQNNSFVRSTPNRQSIDQIKMQRPQYVNSPTLYQQPVFTRNSPQRNTISGICRGDAIVGLQPANNFQMHQQQPPRPQSVLDEMMTGNGHRQHQSVNFYSPNVMLRRKPTNMLTREEIMNQVTEFCRKSMNKTPTKFLAASHEQIASINKDAMSKTSSDISPISYASVTTKTTSPSIASSRSAKIAPPQVPMRKQSLQPSSCDQTDHHNPIYEHIVRQPNVQQPDHSDVNRPTVFVHRNQFPAKSPSESDSVFVSDENTTPPINAKVNHYAVPPKRYVIMQGEHVTPAHVKHYQRAHAIDPNHRVVSVREQNTYGHLQQQNPYDHVRFRHNNGNKIVSNDLLQIYRPNDMIGPTNVIGAIDRRFSPTFLPAIPQHQPIQCPSVQVMPTATIPIQHKTKPIAKPGRIVVLNNVEQMYRPIALPANTISSFGRRQIIEEDWQNDKGRNQQNEQDDRRRGGRRSEDNRRHTLGNDMLVYSQNQNQQPQRTMDLEQPPPVRGYAPVNQGPLFDEDPGIMSEVETASTGFRRGGKQRSSLPVVRTPSKTLERPLGLVFLQYRSETKRALLPNEITSIDTVRALFVRSFPRQLTMAYLEGPNVKIYIHDASKDMFYELEDVRSHLREIRDRSVLRLFESNEVTAPQVLPAGPGVPQPLPQSGGHWDQDQSYFSEPEFDTEYQHQHVHKSKGGKGAPYYVGAAQTLPRGMYSDRNKNIIGPPAKPLRSYGSRGSMGIQYPYNADQLYSIPDGYMSSPERGTRGSYEEPYYSQYGTRGGSVTPIIDEELSDVSLTEDQYALYGHKTGRIPRNANQMYDPTRPEDLHRIRVEHMERQLANLTGLVQKALTQNVPGGPTTAAALAGNLNQNYLGVPGQYREEIDGHSSGSSTSIQANGVGDDIYIREKPPKLGKSSCHKSVSFEKSVSFSDDIQGLPKSHSPQHHADSKPPKPAIKSSTLPRTSSQERDRLKPAPPPKPMVLAPAAHISYRPDLALAPEVYNHLRGLQKKAKDLRIEVRTLRRLSQAQAIAVREDIKDAFMGIRATLMANTGSFWGQGDQEKTRLSREEDLYKQEVIRLEKDLCDLESSVEGLRGEVINRRTRVNMAAVEDMALVLSRASKTVAELKLRFPILQNALRSILSNEMEKVVREEKFLKDEPDRLESALRRCKKLTGTLVTLKRLASVQEQRLPGTCADSTVEEVPRSADIQTTDKPNTSHRMGSNIVSGGIAPENALDALLDELQTFAKPTGGINEPRLDDSTSDDSSQAMQAPNNTVTTQISQATIFSANELNPMNNNNNNNNINTGSLRRLHSYPSESDTDTSPPQQKLRSSSGKPPVPERNAELLTKVINKRVPPPPPPRTSSRSPLASPTSPNIPANRMPSLNENDQNNGDGGGNSSGNESSNSQDRQVALELRHQELLKKQKQLQEQYARLQQISKTSSLPPSSNDILQLKKTGSESNLPQKMGLNMAVSGSMKNLNVDVTIVEAQKNEINQLQQQKKQQQQHLPSSQSTMTTTKQVYETDIL